MSLFLRAARRLGVLFTVLTLSLAVGCSSAKKKDEGAVGGVAAAPGADENVAMGGIGDSDSGKAMGLETIHFPYDSFLLNEETKAQIQANARILKGNPHVKIQIEGHCDQRGGIQYNIALGEKRANSVRSYMEDLGVSAERMTIISFGKEKLADSDTTEEAYSKNRRANFVITGH